MAEFKLLIVTPLPVAPLIIMSRLVLFLTKYTLGTKGAITFLVTELVPVNI